MLLFKAKFHAGLVDGTITLTFRLWERPRVKAGSMQRCHPIGVIEVKDITQVALGDVTQKEAQRAGFEGRAELLEALAEHAKEPLTDATRVYRVELRYAGDGDRAEIARHDKLTPDDVRAIDDELARLDKGARWTAKTLKLIEANPRVAASVLAAQVGRDKPPFKADVVKLKKLGLTESYEVGYELSPRGVAYLAARAGTKRAPSKKAPTRSAARRSRA